jgi:large subunit ribosomal protein L31
MKKGIHPESYRDVIFHDRNADFRFLSRSCVRTDKTEVWEDGEEYPVFFIDVSSASHPFYTGKQTFVDASGRVDRFNKRYGRK